MWLKNFVIMRSRIQLLKANIGMSKNFAFKDTGDAVLFFRKINIGLIWN